jgi:uncharacterized membrane protein
MERLKAFTDGVIAIIITIMVLELKAPEEAGLHALQPLLPILFSYVLSFVAVGVYWLNHRRHFELAEHVTGAVQWWNLQTLFLLSLFPFVTAWMDDNHDEALPVALFGALNLITGLSNVLLVKALVQANGPDSPIGRAIQADRPKALATVLLYLAGIGLSFVQPMLSFGCYAAAALIWVVPSRPGHAA